MSDFVTFPIRGKKLSLSVEVTERLCNVESPFQRIEIVETEVLGKVLLLDGHVQLATFDEHAYHECLVLIPLLSLNSPRRALVVGGGDGGVLRELCKSTTLEQIDMVEIDEDVVRASRLWLPEVSQGAFDDPRVTVHFTDAFPFVEKAKEKYDLIIMDITDVYEGEDGALSESLFTSAFHTNVRNALLQDGLVVTQADNLVFCPYSMKEVMSTLKSNYRRFGSYQGLVPSFGGYSGYCWASDVAAISSTPPEIIPGRYLNRVTWELAFQQLSFAGATPLGEWN